MLIEKDYEYTAVLAASVFPSTSRTDMQTLCVYAQLKDNCHGYLHATGEFG